MANTIKVGIIGCGNISGVYFQAGKVMDVLDIVACADINMEAAKAKAAEHKVRALTVKELLADPEIRVVINITVPAAHGEVGLAALQAGKSVYNEKPLAVTREDGQKMLELAREKKLLVGGAPDTFLGAGLQTCRKLIDDGAIGTPVAVDAFMMMHGHEIWHPNPEFFFKPGGGPMFDMGPYYVTTLVSLLGPVRRATGSAQISFPERTIGSLPKRGTKIKVEIPTHIAGVLDFSSGAVATLIMSFDVWHHRLPNIEIHGSEGSLNVPDPNTFDGPVRLRRAGEPKWTEVPLTHGYTGESRGLGVAEIAYALQSGRPHRASGELAYHVLDIMHAIHDASREGRHVELTSTCARPALLPPGLPKGKLDD